uniref:Uncharacterized protein n=1 Tax=Myoviridae sp. cte0t5 TaxID=2823549 RepID=A0A8S5LH23_9CAUD|nr:MAG TPA: hypothetical protein [Myoviridae sp. cte0t5]
MSNRYSLSQTDSPSTTYRVIDHELDDEIARHPATLPSGSPHPLAGQPLSVVTSPSPAYRVQGEGRARTWGELGGYAVAVIERVPAWAAAPAPAVLREDPAAFDGISDELVSSPTGGLSVRSWFATLACTRAHQLPRWQDRYAAAVAHAPSARLALERLTSVL